MLGICAALSRPYPEWLQNIYLDFNASTPLAPEVIATLTPFLSQAYGNPSSAHWAGIPAKQALEKARAQVAELPGCQPSEIVFTSGGTESNNHAFHFLTEANQRAAYRDTLERSVVPGGQAIIGVFALSGPAQCSGLPVVRYDPASLSHELGQKFELLEAVSHQHRTPQGDVQPLLYCRFARRT